MTIANAPTASTTPAAPTGTAPQAATAPPTVPGPQTAPAPQSRGNTFAIVSFVLGIASVVSSWTFIAPIIGLVFGVLALRNRTAERTLALWGVWLNGAMLALTALAVLAFMLLAAFGILVSLPGLAA